MPVPIFYAIYTDGPYPSVADPYVPDTQGDPASAQQVPADRSTDRNGDDELRAAYLQGARDALTQQRDTLAQQNDSRYGEHFMDSRERGRQAPAVEDKKSERRSRPDQDRASAQPVAPVEDKSPATVFVFKDGHQLETRNYAIMGGTLFDFSGKLLKKIQIDDIDSAATLKANDDRGVIVKLN